MKFAFRLRRLKRNWCKRHRLARKNPGNAGDAFAESEVVRGRPWAWGDDYFGDLAGAVEGVSAAGSAAGDVTPVGAATGFDGVAAVAAAVVLAFPRRAEDEHGLHLILGGRAFALQIELLLIGFLTELDIAAKLRFVGALATIEF